MRQWRPYIEVVKSREGRSGQDPAGGGAECHSLDPGFKPEPRVSRRAPLGVYAPVEAHALFEARAGHGPTGREGMSDARCPFKSFCESVCAIRVLGERRNRRART